MNTFAEALEALKNGKRVRNHFWPEEKLFIFQQVPSIINKDVVPKMQSLPKTVKDYFISTFEDENQQIAEIYYSDQLALVGLSNLITGYSPSPSDVLSDAWMILD